MGLGEFDEAKQCYESLCELGEKSSAENYLKKLAETQEIVWYFHSTDLFDINYIRAKIKKYHLKKSSKLTTKLGE